MAETIGQFLSNYLSAEVVVFIISMLPVLELRGGLIAAKLFGLPWLRAYLISILGNVLPVPFIIIFIERILEFFKMYGPFKKFARWLEEKGRRKGTEMLGKYPKSLFVGLMIFVAIPLPGTGAWTGALVAAFLGLKPKESVLPICLGVIGASIIMSVITYLIPGAFGI